MGVARDPRAVARRLERLLSGPPDGRAHPETGCRAPIGSGSGGKGAVMGAVPSVARRRGEAEPGRRGAAGGGSRLPAAAPRGETGQPAGGEGRRRAYRAPWGRVLGPQSVPRHGCRAPERDPRGEDRRRRATHDA